jgi:hypothetical protein
MASKKCEKSVKKEKSVDFVVPFNHRVKGCRRISGFWEEAHHALDDKTRALFVAADAGPRAGDAGVCE